MVLKDLGLQKPVVSMDIYRGLKNADYWLHY